MARTYPGTPFFAPLFASGDEKEYECRLNDLKDKDFLFLQSALRIFTLAP